MLNGSAFGVPIFPRVLAAQKLGSSSVFVISAAISTISSTVAPKTGVDST
jgi:hypothetical protein